MDENGLLRVITFTAGRQPFVVRCEHETRVKDIVQAIAESWGFRDAAPLFTLCKPSSDCQPFTNEVSQLLRGATLLAFHDRPCKVQSGRDKAEGSPLLLVRSIFGGVSDALEHNQAVLTLTAAQVAADMSVGRYPPQADGNLLNHIIQQGQPHVVMQMAEQWRSGNSCLFRHCTSLWFAMLGQAAASLFLQTMISTLHLCHQTPAVQRSCMHRTLVAVLEDGRM